MPNKRQNGNNKPKSKKGQIKRAARSVGRSLVAFAQGDHEAALTGLTDPYSPEAAHARYPDAGAGSSLTQKSMLSFAATTGINTSAGACAFAFDANFNYPCVFSSTFVPSTSIATWNATRYGDNGTNLLNTYGREARPISMGLRIVNLLSATASAGYIIIAKGGAASSSGTTTFSPGNFSHYEMHPIVHGGEWSVTLRPRGSSAYDFVTKTTYNTNTANSLASWETIYIAFVGTGFTAATDVAMFESTHNFEYIPNEDSPVAVLAEPQPVLNIQMQTAVNAVQSESHHVHVGARTGHQSKIKAAAKKALVKHVLPFALKKAKQAIL